MDFERTLEAQRHRLLRIVAGLVVMVGALSLGPISRRFSDWMLGFVGSILSRAEAAAKYLVIAQAHVMVSRGGLAIDQKRLSERLAQIAVTDNADISLSDCQHRLKALRAILMDVGRSAARLLRQIEKQMRRALRTVRFLPRPEQGLWASFLEWCLRANRIERPPDKAVFSSQLFQ